MSDDLKRRVWDGVPRADALEGVVLHCWPGAPGVTPGTILSWAAVRHPGKRVRVTVEVLEDGE